MKRVLSSLVPVSLRRAAYERRNNAKLETLRRAKQEFRAALDRGVWPADTPAGVNLVAYIRADMGLGAAARGMASAFEAAGIPFNVINLEYGNEASQTDHSWAHKEAAQSNYDFTIVCVNPDNSFNLRTQVPTGLLAGRYVIANWYWELPEAPAEWRAEFEYVDEVWAPSNFIEDAIVKLRAHVPLVRIPPVVQMSRGRGFSRSEFGLPERKFLFLAMFDTRSVPERKNPLGVVRAFKRAFAATDENVRLVLKALNNTDWTQPVMAAVKDEIEGWSNIAVIDRLLSREELASLIDACDCFVSLHRSEGFGLPPAEAMSAGKPVILTNWSGNTDYMTADNCVAVDYQLVKLDRDYGPYKAGQLWAEPDLEQAAQGMKRLAAEPELAKQIGLHGQQTINSHFSPQAVGKMIEYRLQQIREQNVSFQR